MRKISPIQIVPEELNINSNISLYNQALNENKLFDNQASSSEKLSFPGYNNNKESIRILAGGCCSYCGLRINGTKTETVEHYRPKARLDFRTNEVRLEGIPELEEDRDGVFSVKEEKCDYGYFLWGDDFNNLMPSCEACNTGQAYNSICVAKDEDLGNVEEKIPYGKKNFFPIYYNQKDQYGVRYDHRITERYINNISNEIPLLFNPFIDDPRTLFVYKGDYVSGNSSIIKIRPNPSASKLDRLKAEVTINLLGLNRYILCNKRFQKYDKLSTVERQVECGIKYSEYDLDNWARLANSYAIEFDVNSSELLGFGRIFFERLGFRIRDILLANFSIIAASSCSQSLDFTTMVKELFDFYKKYKESSSTSGINNMMNSISNE